MRERGLALERELSSKVAAQAAGASARTRSSDLAFLIQVSRPGLWSTTALFYLMPLGRADFAHSRTLWLGLAYILFPLGFLLYGVNDLADAEADRLNPRKGTFLFGSLGAAEQLAALRWEIAVIQIPFLIAFYVLIGPRILLWFGVLLLAVALYNLPRIGWKSHPPFDVLIQGSYLLVFVLSSWLNNVEQLPWQTFVFGAMFAMHSHIFGEVMDLEPDRLSGRQTTATLLGAVRSKLLIAAFLAVEAALVYAFFGDRVIAGFLGVGAAWFLCDASFVWKGRAYSPREMRLFMLGWNAAAIIGIVWNWSQGSLTHARHIAGL
ncbi:MAG TPA: UbiA family prenyltransferase [Candidatus Methylomirabilis sp.]|nr:UbiA family prenyltransferase [Candidatus Methylomirabilis sp.]